MSRQLKYQLYDNKGNLILQEDLRDLESEIPELLQDLDSEFSIKYLVKIFDLKNMPNKLSREKYQRKLDQARLGILDDKAEQTEILAKDKDLKKEYELRKQAILNSTDCDEAWDWCYKPKKLVQKKNWLTLGLTSEYSLEDIE